MAARLETMLIKQGIEGDDALLRLAQVRLREAGLGAELYPGSPEQLRQQLAFRPEGLPCTVHLPRNLNLLHREDRQRIHAFAVVAACHAEGLIVHDHIRFGERLEETVIAFQDMDQILAALAHSPRLFVEYAAGLPPELFATLFERTRALDRVSACIDVSHVGIQVCRHAYEKHSPGVDVCALKTAPDLPARIDAIQEAAAAALPAVVTLIQRLGRLDKPLHFHLHDGHPLSTLSRYGVSDHLSFLQHIRLPFVYQGRQLLSGMFGPAGLRQIIAAARENLPQEKLSLMLEVHPQEGRSPLGVHASLFAHWKDATNAERMNYWLDMLLRNAVLVRDALNSCAAPLAR